MGAVRPGVREQYNIPISQAFMERHNALNRLPLVDLGGWGVDVGLEFGQPRSFKGEHGDSGPHAAAPVRSTVSNWWCQHLQTHRQAPFSTRAHDAVLVGVGGLKRQQYANLPHQAVLLVVALHGVALLGVEVAKQSAYTSRTVQCARLLVADADFPVSSTA